MTQSCLGKSWKPKDYNVDLASRISQKFRISHTESRIISSRVTSLDDVENYLNPKIRNLLSNPFELLDMRKCVNRIYDAILRNEKITIFGDYDVDGACSTALFLNFFDAIKYENIDFYIPDRILEGYGPNSQAMDKIAQNGASLVITVDCGITAFEPLSYAKSVGLDVIVLDHHMSTEVMPTSIAVVNPNRIDETTSYTNLAGAGVVYMVLIALHQELRYRDYYNLQDISMPNLLEFLDIVALATVCDVMSITGLNRAFVKQGLKVMNARKNVGISAIASIAQISEEIGSYHLGFVIGPRINAGGRVGNASLGSQILSSKNYSECLDIARELNEYNVERIEYEKNTLAEAMSNLEENNYISDELLIAVGKDWHSGVIGIVASRLQDKYERISIVISINSDNNIGKASARSITGIDLGSLIASARQNNILIDGGGHKMAAGFSIKEENIPKLFEYLQKHLSENENTAIALAENKITYYDVEFPLESIQSKLFMKFLECIQPYGIGNPEPKICIRRVVMMSPKILGGKHIKFSIFDPIHKKYMDGISFSSVDTPLEELLLSGKIIDIVGNVRKSTWNNVEKLQFYLSDARWV